MKSKKREYILFEKSHISSKDYLDKNILLNNYKEPIDIEEILKYCFCDNRHYIIREANRELNETYKKNTFRVKIKKLNEFYSCINDINNIILDKKYLKNHLITWGEESSISENSFFIRYNGIGIETNNLIGKIKFKKHIINIGSRFGNKFLEHMISFSEGLIEFGTSTTLNNEENKMDWALILLWSVLLQRAYSETGIPKLYISKQDNISKIRGNIDINKYVKKFYINDGKYHCKYREISFDNMVNQLIAFTFYYLVKNKKNNFIKNTIELQNKFSEICDFTKINPLTLKDVKILNSYYINYERIIHLSQMILKNEQGDIFGEDEEESSGFLFDVASLFEHYIRKLMISNKINVASKNEYIYEDFAFIPHGGYNGKGLKKGFNRIIPDIVIKNNYNQVKYIFDVKYKNFDFSAGVKREDLFQIYTYISKFGAEYFNELEGFGFIYPMEKEKKEFKKLKDKEFQYPDGYNKINKLNEYYYINYENIQVMSKNLNFYIIFYIIDNITSDNYRNSENEFLTTIKHIIGC